MQAITEDNGGGAFQFAERPEDRNRLWKARHNGYQAVRALAPGKANMGTDACVPISALPACLLETKADIIATGEHGIGLHKIVHMETEHGEGVALMKAVKNALDPNGIMNPGKIYP